MDKQTLYVVFDFPRKLDTERRYIRRILKENGLTMLQYSVWQGPVENVDRLQEIIDGLVYREYVKLIVGELVK